MRNLTFHVQHIEAAPYAAVPTLLFKVGIENGGENAIQAITLNTQVRIAVAQRPYSTEEREQLVEVFGPPSGGQAPKSLLWTQSVVHVPAFAKSTVVDLPITCTYDFEVVSVKYFHGVDGAWIPLELLFSGTVFWRNERGELQIEPIPWDREAHCRLAVACWKGMIDAYFPNSAWLRLQRETFTRLHRYRTAKGLPTWEAVLDSLLPAKPESEKVTP